MTTCMCYEVVRGYQSRVLMSDAINMQSPGGYISSCAVFRVLCCFLVLMNVRGESEQKYTLRQGQFNNELGVAFRQDDLR